MSGYYQEKRTELSSIRTPANATRTTQGIPKLTVSQANVWQDGSFYRSEDRKILLCEPSTRKSAFPGHIIATQLGGETRCASAHWIGRAPFWDRMNSRCSSSLNKDGNMNRDDLVCESRNPSGSESSLAYLVNVKQLEPDRDFKFPEGYTSIWKAEAVLYTGSAFTSKGGDKFRKIA